MLSSLNNISSSVPSLSSFTTPGTVPNRILNTVQAFGVEELERRKAEQAQKTEKPKSMLRNAMEKGFALLAPQLYSTLQLANFKPTQLFLAMLLGQQRYEGMKMAMGTEPSFLKGITGILFPHTASTYRTVRLGIERVVSEKKPLDLLGQIDRTV